MSWTQRATAAPLRPGRVLPRMIAIVVTGGCSSYCQAARSEFARTGDPIEERSDLTGEGHRELDAVLQHPGCGVEIAQEDRFVAGVADQPLGDRARPWLGRKQVARRDPLLGDVVVSGSEVGRERLGRRPTDDRFDLVGEGEERL